MSDAGDNAAVLEGEAIEPLNRSFLSLPPGIGSGASVRLVECLIGAAILRVADLQSQAMNAPSATTEHPK